MPSVYGTFEVVMGGDPPYVERDGLTLNRTFLHKEFSGGMAGVAEGQMLAAFTATPGSAGYVALEHFTGVVDGRAGALSLQHSGVMDKGEGRLAVTIVPDSGSGALAGIRGTMEISNDEGGHSYVLHYALG